MRIKIIFGLIVFLAFVLRFYQLGNNPPSLYWDEASLGYNAYSIATTLRDEHGEFLPITRFIAFGDYKPPGYIYIDALVVKLLGLSEFSTRLPSALAGVLLVAVTYFLTKELLKISNWKLKIAPLAAALVAISPWSLQLSRGAFEGNLATLFSGAGILFFLYAVRLKKSIYYLLSSIFFSLAMYTFNTHRVFVPLVIISLAVIFFRQLWQTKKQTSVFFVSLFLFLLPLLPYYQTREAKLRFDEVSWANDLAPVVLSNDRIALDGDTLVAKILHNRRVIFAQQFLKHYLDTFSPDFLFVSGDVNPRLSSQGAGELYLIELPFLFAGIYFILKNRSKTSVLIFSWAILAPIPAAWARETPHALRMVNILPIPQILVALGIVFLLRTSKKYLLVVFAGLYVLPFFFYQRNYFLAYPQKYAYSWQYGYKQAVDYVTSVENKYDRIHVTGHYGRPYIYFLFFQKYNPANYWQTRKIDRDWYGFWYVHGFDKFTFDAVSQTSKRWLFVEAPGQTPKGANIIKTIYGVDNQPVFEISEKV